MLLRATPLCYELKPEEVLAFSSTGSVRAGLLALLGYFGSLRPEEIFALRKSDFFTGERARILAKTFKRFEAHGVGSGLSVAISRACKRDGRVDEPKTRTSRAVVNFWHAEGARQIASLVRELPDGWIFPGVRRDTPIGRNSQFAFWRKYGLRFRKESGDEQFVTLHDLRRSSCLYLGRTLDLPVTVIQEHMRHSDLKTTML
jgi:integrase